MARPRITTAIIVRSTNKRRNSLLVRRMKQHGNRVAKNRTVEVLINNISRAKGRFVYIDNNFQ